MADGPKSFIDRLLGAALALFASAVLITWAIHLIDRILSELIGFGIAASVGIFLYWRYQRW